MLKVVIDTNALIDGSSDDYNYANRIIDLVIAGQITAYGNHATLRENKFLVQKKITEPGYLKKLEYFFEVVKHVDTIEQLAVVEDPEDNKILESAVACRADYLITSDRHLLKLEKFQGTKIVRPEEFWNNYEDNTHSGWQKWLKNFISQT